MVRERAYLDETSLLGLGHVAHVDGGVTSPQLLLGNQGAGQHHRAGGDDGVVADVGALLDHCTLADQHAAADGGGCNQSSVSNGYLLNVRFTQNLSVRYIA